MIPLQAWAFDPRRVEGIPRRRSELNRDASEDLATLCQVVNARGSTHPGQRLERMMRRAVANRRVFPYLVIATAALGLLAGLVVRLIDPKDFPDYGTAVWWSIVTLATVGYGDVVPHTGWGRVVGSAVIVVGVTFVSFLVAIVTSYFISVQDDEKAELERARRVKELAEEKDTLSRIEQRLAAIEARLGD
jgi:voltage-gated potassium channel